jgi:hypothetical protein
MRMSVTSSRGTASAKLSPPFACAQQSNAAMANIVHVDRLMAQLLAQLGWLNPVWFYCGRDRD